MTLNEPVKVFVINLDRDTARLSAMSMRLAELGVPFERVPAILGKNLSEAERDDAVNHFRWWCAIGWPVRPGEIGCAMSHYSIYRQLKEVVCILEDDVTLTEEFPGALNEISDWIDPARPQVVLLSNHARETGKGICRSRGDKFAEAYILTPKAAEVLLAVNWPMQVPCDWWDRWARRGLIELYHYFPTISHQDRVAFGSSTVGNDKAGVSGLPMVWRVIHKMKRCAGKVLDRVIPVRDTGDM